MRQMTNNEAKELTMDISMDDKTESFEFHQNCVENQEITEPLQENCLEIETADSCDFSKSECENEISVKLNIISCQLEELNKEFLSKLKNDAHKEKLIDSLHQELQSYKNDLIKKHVQSMAVDIIKIIDDIRKLSEHYQSMNAEDVEPNKLLDLLERIPGDLEDIFLYQGVKPFTCSGNEFDAARQRVLKRVVTSDMSLDNKVAKSLKPGYEMGDRVIRPEIVSVYLYQKLSDEHEMEIYDE